MEKHYSLIHADEILAKLMSSPLKDTDITIESWSNGREQGYHLISYDLKKALCFAQQRNSDSVVIITDEPREFDISTNMPSDKAWKNRIDLYPDKKAIDYIVGYFTTKEFHP